MLAPRVKPGKASANVPSFPGFRSSSASKCDGRLVERALNRFRAVGRVLAFVLPCICMHGQVPNTTPGRSGDSSTAHLSVRLVDVLATVTDVRGAAVSDLTQGDFKILEDGVPQKISIFERGSEMPLSIVLAIDPGVSPGGMKMGYSSARKFVHSVLLPRDRLSLFQISEDVNQVTPFTSDTGSIERGMDSLQKGAGSSLFDAVYLAADSLLDRQGRKIIVLITDGGDTTSKTDQINALHRVQEANAIVYSMVVVPMAATAGRNAGGKRALAQISEDTGGKCYHADSIDQLDRAFRLLSEELRAQYWIAYYPNRGASDSIFRRIAVEVYRKDSYGNALQTRHRAGYYTARPK
jgi:Ca-activated chloride channel family protein